MYKNHLKHAKQLKKLNEVHGITVGKLNSNTKPQKIWDMICKISKKNKSSIKISCI